MVRTAAALIIGNEILSGKIQEKNVAFLARELFALGVALRRVVVCPDDLEIIAKDLNDLRAAFDFVFTSGGVGPTHDDITIEAIAHAFGRDVERSAEVESMIRRHFGERVTEGHLRMANMPAGAELVRSAAVPWPTIAIDNVFVLPGVPEIFELKLAVLRDRLRGDAPFVSEAVYTRCDEGEIAALLEQIVVRHPDVTVGSYPAWRNPEYKVKLTFDSTSESSVRAAADALVASLAPDLVVRRERS